LKPKWGFHVYLLDFYLTIWVGILAASMSKNRGGAQPALIGGENGYVGISAA
jgi:hypothetical protein